MKHIANPVEVEAHVVTATYDLGSGVFKLLLDDQTVFTATPDMTARMKPTIGDYVVTQSDGYVYLNPRDVFLYKYHPDRTREQMAAWHNRIHESPPWAWQLVTRGMQWKSDPKLEGITRDEFVLLRNICVFDDWWKDREQYR